VTTPPLACAQCGAPLLPEQRVCPTCRALQPSRETFAPGVTIDRGDRRIVLDARVGEGGMGVVWRAWQFYPPGSPRGDKPELLALKVLRPMATQRTAVRDLFLREAAAMRRLSHPNVVAYHDLFEHEGSLVLAIEYVDGETLEAVIARHVARAQLAGAGALPGMALLRAWHYFQQLLGALGGTHALGIVHRDVKPSNVLLRRDGLVKLGDFGIARFADAPITQATAELGLGTGAYMAPEQVLSRAVDSRTDLYSAAIVFYEMLTGRTPFSADRGEFLVRKDQVDATPPPIRTFLPQAPFVMDALFARALAKDPAARFSSAIEMGDAFRSGLGLPETPEWLALADFAHTAQALAATRPAPTPAGASAATGGAADPRAAAGAAGAGAAEETQHQKKLATLREFVSHGYKTKRMSSM
jgi:serine/threonine protein kinase